MSYPYSKVLEKPVEGEFDDITETIIPREAEVRVVANRNRECKYYYTGIEQCREKMLRLAGDPAHKFHEYGFLPCKRLVDAHYRCLTEEKYGYSLEDVPEEGRKGAEDFIQCAFKEINPLSLCRKFFDETLRGIFRSPGNKLSDV